MCLAIYKPVGVKISKKTLAKGFSANDDGAGFAVAKRNKLIVRKGFFTFKKFWKAYSPFMEEASLIHFRIATHGSCSAENCHPFQIGEKFAVIHNGVLPIKVDKAKDESDTKVFTECVLTPLLERIDMKSEALKFVIEGSITGSKVVVLRNDGECVIFKESMGNWEDGAWYSNYSARTWESSTSKTVGFAKSTYWDHFKDSDQKPPATTDGEWVRIAGGGWKKVYGGKVVSVFHGNTGVTHIPAGEQMDFKPAKKGKTFQELMNEEQEAECGTGSFSEAMSEANLANEEILAELDAEQEQALAYQQTLEDMARNQGLLERSYGR